MRKPNLFIVGKQKAGTTALHQFLSKHPDIFMSEPKEPMFFCTDMHKESDVWYKKANHFPYRTESQFMSLFSSWKDQKVAGESTTQYLDSKDAAENIHRFNPDAKIVIMLREPVDYLYSLHGQYLYEMEEDIDDFKMALEAEDDRRQGKRVPPRIKCPSWLWYSETVKYAEQIKRYIDVFPRENVKIILFDDFQKDNKQVYLDVVRFLDVDDSFIPEFEKVNAHRTVRFRSLKRFVDHPMVWGLPKKLLPKKVYESIKGGIYGLIVKKQKRVPLDPQFKAELMRGFKPEVEKLSSLLGMDLITRWAYDKL